MNRNELTDITYHVGANEGCDHAVLLACAIAESEGNERAARWAYAGNNRTSVCEPLAENKQYDDLQVEINTITSHGSSDISFGLCQQTYRWSVEWLEWNRGWDARAVCDFRILYYTPEYALATAARLLRRYYANTGNRLESLYRYNKPNGDPVDSVKHNYQRALAEATVLVAAYDPEEIIPEPPTPPEQTEDMGMVPEQIWEYIWHAGAAGVSYSPDYGIVKFWKEHYRELGSVISPEVVGEDGSIYQSFAHGIIHWTDHAEII